MYIWFAVGARSKKIPFNRIKIAPLFLKQNYVKGIKTNASELFIFKSIKGVLLEMIFRQAHFSTIYTRR